MRSFPRNSPQAAARIVAMTMLADGHLTPSELEVLDRAGAGDKLGLSTPELRSIVHTFCEDLLMTADMCWADACRIEPETIASMMQEIDDEALRRTVLAMCLAVVDADGHIAEGESIVMHAIVEHWGLHREMLRPKETEASPQPA